MRHLVSNDIQIWFGLRICYKMKKIKIAYIIIFLYTFWKSFVFFAHVAEPKDDVGKLWKLGRPSILYIGMTYILDGVIWCMSCKVGHPIAHSTVISYQQLYIVQRSFNVITLHVYSRHQYGQYLKLLSNSHKRPNLGVDFVFL